MRRGLRRVNPGMLLIWRLGLGRLAEIWPRGFGRLMVIEHVGRRSGTVYRTPVNFTPDGDHVYCIAGFGEGTDWYRNVLARPDIAVWLPGGRWAARAEDASGDPRRLQVMRRVLIDSGFAAPLIGLYPNRLGDVELEKATASYRLVRIRPLRHEDAPDGPGDLAWMWWPLGGAFVVGYLMGRLRRGHGRPGTGCGTASFPCIPPAPQLRTR
jgi:deazaflavin-dependent oxidoreductase (nitroreductase family)